MIKKQSFKIAIHTGQPTNQLTKHQSRWKKKDAYELNVKQNHHHQHRRRCHYHHHYHRQKKEKKKLVNVNVHDYVDGNKNKKI